MNTDTKPTTTDANAGAAWLSVADAAEALGLSKRTIRRRCSDGDLIARFTAGVWEINGQSVTANRPDGHGQKDTARPIGQDVATVLSVAKAKGTENAANRSRPIGQRGTATRPIGQTDTANERREIETELRAQLAREREFSAILKAQLEAVTQSEAQTKAALREALRAMPKALTAGNIPTAPTEAPQRDQSGAAGDVSQSNEGAQQSPIKRRGDGLSLVRAGLKAMFTTKGR